MKVLHVLVSILVLVLLLALGGYGTYLAFFGGEQWTKVVSVVADNPLLGGSGALAVAIIALLWVLTAVPSSRRRGRYLSFENPGGDVQVSLDAISEYLNRIGGEFGAVLSMKPDVRIARGGLCVNLDCRVRAGTAIPPLSQAIQDRARESIQSDLGLGDPPSIRVTVRQIVGEASPSKRPDRVPVQKTTPTGDEGTDVEPRVS